jgi:hypothetical protein
VVVYWFMFAWPALISFLVGSREDRRGGTTGWVILFIVFVVLIGLRTETGGDWYQYNSMTELISFQDLSTALSTTESGYALVTWISTRLGWGIYGSTTFCGLVLMYAVIRFSRRQPDSWLALTAAVPYLIVVIGMGYVRQAAAIGFVMLALLDFEEGKRLKCGMYIILATLFHTSALVVAPFIAIVATRGNIVYLVPVVLGAIPAILYLANTRYDIMVSGYVNAEYSSSGTLVRLFMNAVPSSIFLINRRKFNISSNMTFLWTVFSLLSFVLFLAFAASPSSTIVDRLGLYLIPIQLMAAGHLPAVVARTPSESRFVTLAGIIYFAAVLLVWLNYADNSYMWKPYRSLLTG